MKVLQRCGPRKIARCYEHEAGKKDVGADIGGMSAAGYDRSGNRDSAGYQAAADFMARLQKIVYEYDFAQHNGYYHTVSGLPGMYGESLTVIYASGERIYVHDNQSGFLPYEAEKALVNLFGAATKLEK